MAAAERSMMLRRRCAEAERSVDEVAGVVGPAMHERVAHAREPLLVAGLFA